MSMSAIAVAVVGGGGGSWCYYRCLHLGRRRRYGFDGAFVEVTRHPCWAVQFQFQWCEAGRQESSMTKPFRYLLPDRVGSM